MRVIRASLAGSARGPAQGRALALVSDLIWAHIAPAHGLEHLRAKASDDGVDVYLFLRATSDAAALAQARTILDRARTPLMSRGYRAKPTYR
ncbi:hypothetical protein [Streptomyces sp. DSM 40907]|uniref:hypothetical protein n=1 Tax=Streptomyces kutzneri TaxID=3051179 RepID=UPI0028D5387E|nr:hypothetical protein [Streptomyces sp. DSM 40907]